MSTIDYIPEYTWDVLSNNQSGETPVENGELDCVAIVAPALPCVLGSDLGYMGTL